MLLLTSAAPGGKGRNTDSHTITHTTQHLGGHIWELPEHKTCHCKVLRMSLKPHPNPLILCPLFLIRSLDEEEALKWIENEDLRDFHKACWEIEFLPVAQKLMKMLRPEDLTAWHMRLRVTLPWKQMPYPLFKHWRMMYLSHLVSIKHYTV